MLQGGPRFLLTWTLIVVDSEPVELVETMYLRLGALHPTGILWSKGGPTSTVGSPGVSLHSRTYPYELAANPVPVTVTTSPCLIPPWGVAASVPVANASALAKQTKPPVTHAAAINQLRRETFNDFLAPLVMTR
jgi:hypothetical protein